MPAAQVPDERERRAPGVIGSRSSTRARLGALVGDRYGAVAALAVSSILSGFTESGILVLLAQIGATIVDKAKQVHLEIGPLHVQTHVGTLFAIAVILAVARLFLQAPISILPARIAGDVQARLRKNLFGAFTRASWEVKSRDLEGHLQETMTSQVIQATMGALQATTLVTSSFTFAVLMVSALALNIRAAGVVLGAALLLFALLRPLNTLGVRRSRELSQAQMRYAGGIGEAVRVAEETQVFGVAEAQRARIDHFIDTARGLFFRTQMLARLTPNLYQSLMYLLLVAGLAGLYAVGRGHVASLAGVILLLVRAGTNGQQIQGCYQGLRQSLPFIERLQEAARRYAEGTAPAGERPLASVSALAFEHVSFSYRPGRPVLRDVSFEIAGGEAVGIIGPSGAGKSTLVQILLQLRSPGEGRYLVGGVPAAELRPEDWHRQVAYVPQEPRLVHATAAENIRYFRAGIDDEAVRRAARLARIHEDILSWPDGYETLVGPRADAVSGGQQQRICLARALAARPGMLVLDEPTSALDPQSEMLIQESLLALKSELTLFIVAHRMSTLDVCDRVMVILDGGLAEFDSTDRLRERSPYYRSAIALAAGPNGASVAPREGGAVPAVGNGQIGTSRVQLRAPDFFIVGHPKCGTTALHEMLSGHPQIFMPELKEPRFLADDVYPRARRRERTLLPETLEQYLALFAPARPAQRAGEASPLYLRSSIAAGRIAEVQPDARIIAILREPADFLRSLHLQFVQTHVEPETDLRRALALEAARRGGWEGARGSHWPQALLYSEYVRYVEQLRRYHERFSPERILVLIYDDFNADNEATVRRVLRFLGVEEEAPIAPSRANPTVRVRSQRLHELVHAVSLGQSPVTRAVKSSVKTLTPRGLRRGALHATQQRLILASPRPADAALMRELRDRFHQEVAALSEYLDRDLVKLWGYGEAA